MRQAKTLKKAIACALAAGFLVLPAAAQADQKIDENLLRAQAEKAAAALGELRDGYSVPARPTFVEGAGIEETAIRKALRIEGIGDLETRLDRTTTGSVPALVPMPRTDIRIVYYG